MKKIIFFDVDGTLMDHHGFHIPESTINTLHKLKKQNYLLCIATGRSLDSLQRTPILDLIEWDGLICNNGQIVLDRDNNILFKSIFNPSTITRFIEIATNLNFPVVVKCSDRFITMEPDQNAIDVHALFNNPIPRISTYNNQDVDAMIIYAPNHYDYSDFKELDDINIIPCAFNYAEVSLHGITKASSIKYLLKHYNLDSYIAFGDSPNDIEMLCNAKEAIVMGQSTDAIKKHATFVTAPLNQDGIQKACLELKLI